jgi:quercetin dioxygenase-like cupin family protein
MKKSSNDLRHNPHTIAHWILYAGLGLASLAPVASFAGKTDGDGRRDAPAYSVETLVHSGVSWDGQVLPAYPAGQPKITILRIRIPPGASLPVHKHPVINAGLLLSGSLTVVAESGQILHLKAGNALVELVDTWHFGRNDGDIPAEIVVFYAGTENSAISVPRPTD